MYIIYIKKKPLVHIFNVSFKSGVFPDKVKIAKVKVPLRKAIEKVPKITDQYSFYWFFFQDIRKYMHNRLISFVQKQDVL